MGLAGCSGPSHLPPPWELPGAALGSVIENAAYGARRERVAAYLTLNQFDEGAMDIAGVPPDRRDEVVSEFTASPDIYLDKANPNRIDVESVTVLLMVYGR